MNAPDISALQTLFERHPSRDRVSLVAETFRVPKWRAVIWIQDYDRTLKRELVDDLVVRQINWSSWRFDMSWSENAIIRHRFCITRRTDGYTVLDLAHGDQARFRTLQLAQTWAGIRVNEQVIHRSGELS